MDNKTKEAIKKADKEEFERLCPKNFIITFNIILLVIIAILVSFIAYNLAFITQHKTPTIISYINDMFFNVIAITFNLVLAYVLLNRRK